MTTGVVPKCRMNERTFVKPAKQYTFCGAWNVGLCFFVAGRGVACLANSHRPKTRKESLSSPSMCFCLLFLFL